MSRPAVLNPRTGRMVTIGSKAYNANPELHGLAPTGYKAANAPRSGGGGGSQLRGGYFPQYSGFDAKTPYVIPKGYEAPQKYAAPQKGYEAKGGGQLRGGKLTPWEMGAGGVGAGLGVAAGVGLGSLAGPPGMIAGGIVGGLVGLGAGAGGGKGKDYRVGYAGPMYPGQGYNGYGAYGPAGATVATGSGWGLGTGSYDFSAVGPGYGPTMPMVYDTSRFVIYDKVTGQTF